MKVAQTDWRLVARLTEAPDVAVPWLDRFYEPGEVAILRELAEGGLSADELRRRLRAGARVAAADVAQCVERAYRRVVIARSKTASTRRRRSWNGSCRGRSSRGGATSRPKRKRTFAHGDSRGGRTRCGATSMPSVDGRAFDAARDGTYLLLHEAEEALGEWSHIYLFPCGCRAIMQGCAKPTLNCLCSYDWHDRGWEISLSRAVDIVREANRRGLMQTGHLPGASRNSICNCCNDCCFPMLVSERLDAARLYPRTRYLAEIRPAACDGCLRCVARCPFGAISSQATGHGADDGSAPPLVDPTLCRGCGLCATGCRRGSIEMLPLAQSGAASV